MAIIAYSAENNKDYKTVELTIEIWPIEMPPTLETALEVNGLTVLINEKAFSGGESEFTQKYGDFTLLTKLWLDGNEYTINAPTLQRDDVIELVRNMRVLISSI